MRKIIKFSKGFIFSVILSCAIIIAGIFVICTKGLNLGIDFRPGLVEEFKIAPTAVSLSYKGANSVSVQVNAQGVSLVVSGVGTENTTHEFGYVKYSTIESIAAGFNTVDGITATVKAADPKASAQGLFTNSAESTILTEDEFNLHYPDIKATDITADNIRDVLKDLPDIAVKAIGLPLDNHFQIRVGDDGSDKEISKKMQEAISEKLSAAYGVDNYAVTKTDFIGAQFSGKLLWSSVILVVASLFLIWVYATIRFKWDFALGSVIAILHDALVMIAFMAFLQIEFTSTSIAAILTIIGYSINNTVVVLDRVRENIKLIKVNKFSTLWDYAQTQLLNRSLLTAFTTLLAVFSLFFFTTGSIHDFALALIIGLICGTYSSIFIAGAFICTVRKNWKPSDDERKTQVLSVEED